MERRNESHSGTYGWLAIGAFVCIWDALAPETLSGAADRALEKHPALTIAAIGTVALHLLNVLRPEIDPLHQLAERVRHER